MKVLDSLRPTRPVLILPILHVIFCFVVELTMSEDGWKWFLPTIVDLPFSEFWRRITFLSPFHAFLIFGTLWWYSVSLVFRFFYVLLSGDEHSE